jgi:type IV pilus assembly protein PilA
MTPKSRDRLRQAGSQNGFTLVELMVAIVTIGILAAIAIPTFLGQTDKASDASAKTLVSHGALALQTYAVDHDGYGATRAELIDIAPELGDADDWALDATASGYTLTVTSRTDHTYTIQRSLGGPALRTCTVPGAGGCAAGGTW